MRPLVDAGVVGFKCFLCQGGDDQFPHVSVDDVEKALKELLPTKTVLAVHHLHILVTFYSHVYMLRALIEQIYLQFHAEYGQSEKTNPAGTCKFI